MKHYVVAAAAAVLALGAAPAPASVPASPRRLRRMIPDHVSSLVRPYGLARRADERQPDPPKTDD